jgi:hypothetical protein
VPPTPLPSPSVSPTPTLTPTPNVADADAYGNAERRAAGHGDIHVKCERYGNFANGGGADQPSRFNISSAFIPITRNTGFFRYGASAGVYSIPVVGLSGNKTFQSGANVNTFSLIVGYLATLIGQEYTYSYQNWNIQRGLVWNMETAVSRGARLSITGGKFIGALEVNDGFFSGHYLGLEGSLTMAPDADRAFQFVFVVPNSQAPGNWTAAIANQRLYNFMYTVSTMDAGALHLARRFSKKRRA